MIIKILSCTLRNQTHIIILMFIPIYDKSVKKKKKGRKEGKNRVCRFRFCYFIYHQTTIYYFCSLRANPLDRSPGQVNWIRTSEKYERVCLNIYIFSPKLPYGQVSEKQNNGRLFLHVYNPIKGADLVEN